MTAEERAEKLLESLVGEETTMGPILGPGPENDPNRWRPRGKKGESYRTILAAIQAAVSEERERVLAADRARFHMNAMLPATWEYDTLEEAKEQGRAEERESCAKLAKDLYAEDGYTKHRDRTTESQAKADAGCEIAAVIRARGE